MKKQNKTSISFIFLSLWRKDISTPCNAYGILKPLVLKLFCKTWLLYLQKISVVHLKYFMKVLPKIFISFCFVYILFYLVLSFFTQFFFICSYYWILIYNHRLTCIMNKYLTCGKWILQCYKLSAFVTTCPFKWT